MVKIVWDETKRQTNLTKHGGLGFADLTVEFFANGATRPARGGRFLADGRLGGAVVAAVFVRLGSQGISVISMRPASRKERSLL